VFGYSPREKDFLYEENNSNGFFLLYEKRFIFLRRMYFSEKSFKIIKWISN